MSTTNRNDFSEKMFYHKSHWFPAMNNLLRKVLVKIYGLLGEKEIRILSQIINAQYSQRTPLPLEQPHYAYWERQAYTWDKTVSPVRPSNEDIKIYRNLLRGEGRKHHILILGSTPELRDLVSRETNAKIYLADFSVSMPSAMLSFTRDVDVFRETWVKSNWLDLPFPEKFFDVILGDVVLHQVSPSLESALLEKIKYMLKDDGAFITRLFFLDDNFTRQDLENITSLVLSGSFSNEEKTSLIALQTVWLFADLKKRRFNRKVAEKRFGEMMTKRNDNNPILRRVHDILINDKNSYRVWSPPDEKELTHTLAQSFQIITRKHASNSIYSEYFPIVLLRPE